MLELLLESSGNAVVSLEVFEDVGVRDGESTLASQTKSSITANPVSNAAKPFWKSLKTWLDSRKSGQLSLENTVFELYVFGDFEGEVCNLFSESTSEAEAHAALSEAKTILQSEQKELPAPISAVLGADVETLIPLIVQFRYRHGSGASIEDLKERLRHTLIPPEFVDNVLLHALGWVKQQADTLLERSLPAAISVADFRSEITTYARSIAFAACFADLAGPLRDKLDRALESVATSAARFISALDVERPDDRISLSISSLTIKVKGDERDDYLWEIGSGSNWLAYHVATSLALQLFFILRVEESPVPSFIVYDQPSQVYFPKRLADDDILDEGLDPKLRDTDVEALRKTFRAFGSATATTKGQLQVIVLDHAAENVWAGLEGIHEVEDWRQGRKLVPAEWL